MLKIKEIYIYICMINIEKYIILKVDLEISGSRVRKRGFLLMILNLNIIMVLWCLFIYYMLDMLVSL